MTSDVSVYTAHDIPDLINALPTMFGFRPDDSLVAVATHGPRRRFGFRLRLDLPETNHEAVATFVGDHLERNNADGAILIVVSKRQDTARSLLRALCAHLDQRLLIIVAARTDGSRYWSEEPGFPADGVSMEISDHHPAIVHAVAAGQHILPSREALAQRFDQVGEPHAAWLKEALPPVLATVSARVDQLGRGAAAVGAKIVTELIRRSAHGERLADAEVLEMSAWTALLDVRDAVWMTIERDNAVETLAGLTAVIPRVVGPGEAPILSLAAFAAWLCGDGAQALIAVSRALNVDPAHSMARLMLDVVEKGVPPATWSGWGVERSA